VLAIVQAGGQGSRMDVLTRERAKPALPFAGTHRLIDFVLSSLVHSGISDVWVSVQYQAGSLDQHLAGGRPWDLDGLRGGFRRMVPEQGSGSQSQSGFSRGNADDLYRMRDEVAVQDADLVVVSSSDHVFRLDLREVITRHTVQQAECTVVTTEVGATEARNNAVLTVDGSARVTDVVDKPHSPVGGTVATEVFVYDRRVLLEQLERLRRSLQRASRTRLGADGDTGLGDFADHLLPRLVERGAVLAVPMPGYWRDVGRPDAYLMAHRDLVRGRMDVFDDRSWPVLGQRVDGAPARVRKGATVIDSALSAGCVVGGEVVGSVLGPHVTVQPGARVEDSVIFGEVLVEAGAVVETAVVDERVRIGREARVGSLPRASRVRAEDVTLVGADAVVRRRSTLAAGGRMEPGSTT
jgi:glucose-1-phosphate adenylyltransferase